MVGNSRLIDTVLFVLNQFRFFKMAGNSSQNSVVSFKPVQVNGGEFKVKLGSVNSVNSIKFYETHCALLNISKLN